MMISPEYCLTLARYNSWQNRQLMAAFERLDAAELTRDRKAFFGSILGTANHLLWGDRIWMSRFAGTEPPAGGIKDSTGLMPDRAAWERERFQTDTRITGWAKELGPADLAGDLSWYSGAMGRTVAKSMALCVTHMFNHQTHHRGQIHTMLTAAGAEAPVSDLVFMPEDETGT